ncbi:MAG TPA: thiamine pyrophosphate-dependent dehydrogenase E1 component subunit alpha [Thermotogota bacterium]|nr:thiamine pyrophosphate-dependent dehydrogenase E1 component subunit alpha [Thermotogota bacterium]HRW93939.1 thiamine pyrophosphate-dependent dehydrogenase E1 component subunit alpha [Thermotogota bacterium]
MKKVERLYEKMLLIRNTEREIEALFAQGFLRGTTHGYIGEEAIAVGVLAHVDIQRDIVTGTHRSHGHYLAMTEDPFSLFSELMGLPTGVTVGRGGSQHLSFHNFITNGLTGGMVPIGVGMALAEKLSKSGNAVVSFLGDGAMNEGYVMEAFNLAAVFRVPILFVLENNGYAMSSASRRMSAGSFSSRVDGFGLTYTQVDSQDVVKISRVAEELLEKVRAGEPQFLEVKTYRFCGHSKSDPREYVSQEEEVFWQGKDPLLFLENNYPRLDFPALRDRVEDKVRDASERVKKMFREGEGND